MKRLWAIPLLTLLLAVFCIYPLWEVDRFCTEADHRLNDCIQWVNTGDFDRAAEQAKAICNDFEAWRMKASTFLRHTEISPVREAMAELLACSEAGDITEFHIVCRRVQTLIAHLAEYERPDWGNLL